jgi:uncharacterized protein (DUF1778 family)
MSIEPQEPQDTAPTARKPQLKGHARRIAEGKRVAQLTIDRKNYETIATAARESGLSVAHFFTTHTLAAAKKILAAGG